MNKCDCGRVNGQRCYITFIINKVSIQLFKLQYTKLRVAIWVAKMAITAKIKLLRIVSVLQSLIAAFLVVFGIVERVHVRWLYTGVGMPIWIGIWVSGRLSTAKP